MRHWPPPPELGRLHEKCSEFASRHRLPPLTVTPPEATPTLTETCALDPQLVGEDPRYGQGHLHYQIDGGPVIATTATKLSFHDLAPGPHTVVVSLAGNDHRPLGPKRILTVNIPSDGKPQRSKARKRAATSKATTDGALSAR